MVTAKLRGEMRLVVLVLKELEHEIENVYIAGENTGIGGVLANKVCCWILHMSCSVLLKRLFYVYYLLLVFTFLRYCGLREG